MIEYFKPWLLFWLAAIVAHGYMDYSFYRKWQGWAQGIRQPFPHKGKQRRIVKIWLAEVLLQRQLFGLSLFRWLVHLLIFWGFAGLALLSLTTFFLRPLDFLGIGWAHYFFSGKGYLFTKVWGDSFGLALLLGLVLAGIRRFILKPAQQGNKQMDIYLVAFLFWLTLSGFFLEGLRLSLSPGGMDSYSFIGRLFMPAGIFTVEQLKFMLVATWSIHAFSALALLVYLPHSKMMHSILAPVVIALNASEESEREDLYWPDIGKYKAKKSRET